MNIPKSSVCSAPYQLENMKYYFQLYVYAERTDAPCI